MRFPPPGELQPVRSTPIRRKGRNPAFYLLISLFGLAIVAMGVLIYLHSPSATSDSGGFFSAFNGFDQFVRDLLWTILSWALIIFGSILVLGGIVITVLASAD